jgi:ribosomal protein S18 acetylase RimI-like enzyme
MPENTNGVSVERVRKANKALINQINPLLDKGKTWSMGESKTFLSDKGNALFMAYFEGKPAGFLTAYFLQRFDNKKKEILLYGIGVAKKFRRKGVGKELTNATKLWGKQLGAKEMWVLTNRSNNPAMALYRSTGGVQAKTLDDTMFVYKLR